MWFLVCSRSLPLIYLPNPLFYAIGESIIRVQWSQKPRPSAKSAITFRLLTTVISPIFKFCNLHYRPEDCDRLHRGSVARGNVQSETATKGDERRWQETPKIHLDSSRRPGDNGSVRRIPQVITQCCEIKSCYLLGCLVQVHRRFEGTHCLHL